MAMGMKEKAIEWELKRGRLKRVAVVFGLILLGVVGSAVWSLVVGNEVRWWLMAFVGLAAAGGLVMALSAYTNTALVAMYYMANVVSVEKLELVTGRIVEVSSLRLPYVGSLYMVSLDVVGESVKVYCPGKLLMGVDGGSRVRVWSYDGFAVKVEGVGGVEFVEKREESTANVS